MTREEVAAKVIQIIKDDFVGDKTPHVDEDTKLRDGDMNDTCLDLDSLDMVEIVMEMEDEFELELIENTDAAEWVTVKDVIDYVHGRLA